MPLLIDDIVALLNEAVRLDSDAVTALVMQRVPCNEALALHPTIQVHVDYSPEGKTTVGLLGMLNGIVAKDCERIVAVFDEDSEKIVQFGYGPLPENE